MSEFLAGLTGASAGASAGQSLLNAGITAATGGYKSRPSNRDAEFMQDLADKFTPREAARQNQFLDMTYGEDTRRLLERTQEMSGKLGMSAWELMGAPGADQLPTPTMDSAKGSGTKGFMDTLVPLQAQKLQAMTQIQTAMIAAQAQRDVANIQTAGGEEPKARTAEALSRIPVNEQEAINKKAQELLFKAQTVSEQANADRINTESMLNTTRNFVEFVQLIQGAMGTETIDWGFYKSTTPKGGTLLLQLIEKIDQHDTTAIDDLIKQLPADDVAVMFSEMAGMTKAVVDTLKGVPMVGKGLSDAAGFLGRLFPKRKIGF